MYRNITLQEGAFVISDAHYSHKRPKLLSLIKDIHSKKLQPTQLLLMGDIFDALFGSVSATHIKNQEIITLLNEINEEIEIVYLEGNHDFNLQEVFKKAEVFSFYEQPVSFIFHESKVTLAHGDFDVSYLYRVYTDIIRSPLTLWILKTIDSFTNNSILNRLDTFLDKKNDCKEFIGFKEFIEKRSLQKHGCDYFIEGHYHQNRVYEFEKYTYINLAAFACNQRYFIVELSQDNKLFLEEKSYKEI